MTKFAATVTNEATNKSFTISTAPVNPLGKQFWQTAVFKQRFGPFCGLFRPVLFLGGASDSSAKAQHERVIAFVRELPPAEWSAARDKLAVAIVEEEIVQASAAHDDFFQTMLKMTNSTPDQSTNSN